MTILSGPLHLGDPCDWLLPFKKSDGVAPGSTVMAQGDKTFRSFPASMPFIAPVDTFAGGNVLRMRIRSLEGFDEEAFQAARTAEQRREAGSFVV